MLLSVVFPNSARTWWCQVQFRVWSLNTGLAAVGGDGQMRQQKGTVLSCQPAETSSFLEWCSKEELEGSAQMCKASGYVSERVAVENDSSG